MSQYDPIVAIRLPEPLVLKLKEAARRDDRPMSSFARRLIERGLDQYEEHEQTTPVRTHDGAPA